MPYVIREDLVLRPIISLCFLGLSAAAFAVAGGHAAARTNPPAGVNYSVLPTDEEKLGLLDTRHRQLIERTIRKCTGLQGEVPHEDLSENPCVAKGVEAELARTGDPQLTAFYHALPDEVRLNHICSEMEWQPAVKDRIAETKPLRWEAR